MGMDFWMLQSFSSALFLILLFHMLINFLIFFYVILKIF